MLMFISEKQDNVYYLDKKRTTRLNKKSGDELQIKKYIRNINYS